MRYYSPPHGLFLTRDPHEGVTERSASRNGYSYVEGNPTNWTDPSGMNPDNEKYPSTKNCGNYDDCAEIEKTIYALARAIYIRFLEMYEDKFDMYFFPDQRLPSPDTGTSWRGHQEAVSNIQTSLEKTIACYFQRGSGKYPGTDKCDNNMRLVNAAKVYLALDASTFKSRKAGGSTPPSLPDFALLPAESSRIHQPTQCISLFGVCLTDLMLAAGIGFTFGHLFSHIVCGYSGLLHAQP